MVKVIHVIAGTWRENGGPSEVVPLLVKAQNAVGIDAELWTLEGDQSEATLDLNREYDCVRYFKFFSSVRISIGMFLQLLKLRRDTVIHLHGLWLFPNWASIIVSRIRNMRLILSPHGVLTKDMLAYSYWKKRVSFSLFERFALKHGLFHFLSENEYISSKHVFSRTIKRFIVVGNGVPVREIELRQNFSNTDKFIFFSRVSEIKGIFLLLDIWQKLHSQNSAISLSIVGPVDPRVKQEFESKIRNLASVKYLGAVYGPERFKLLSQHDVFILPTKGEGYPTAILEAAAAGLTILTTKESNVTDLIDLDLIDTIRRTHLLEDVNERIKNIPNSQRAEKLAWYVRDNKSWDTIAKVWKSTYFRND